MTGAGDAADPSLGASAEAIRDHYDAGNAFFAAWLDPALTYSAGRWLADGRTAATLEHAQQRKLDWHLDAASVRPGARILDIGCGWGSLLACAVRDRKVAQAVGLTPSRLQCDWIGRHIGCAEIEVVCSLWQDADTGAGFDAVFSLGALEHFARPGLSMTEKIQSYRNFFEFCRRSLAEDGRLSIQFVGWMDVPPEAEADHLPREVFPESNLPRLPEVIAAADLAFHPLVLENVPTDYVLTLHAWLARINARRDELVRTHGRRLVKTYIHAFRRFLLGFEAGSLGLYRIAFRPRGTGH